MSKTQTKTEKETSTNPKSETLELFADTNVTMKSGHMVKDAEIIADGKYVKMRIASNKQYEVDGEVKTNTNYFDALISHNLKDAFDQAKDFKKGDWIYLKGEDSTKSFDTPEGYKKTASTIFAYHVVLKKEKEDKPSSDQGKNSPAVSSAQVVPA